MKVNKIDNGSVAELTLSHVLDAGCPCGPTVSRVATKDGSGYARYNHSLVLTHQGQTQKKSFVDEFFEEFAKRFPGYL